MCNTEDKQDNIFLNYSKRIFILATFCMFHYLKSIIIKATEKCSFVNKWYTFLC